MKRTRKEQYDEKMDALLQYCTKCIKSGVFSPSYSRCEECSIGMRIRWLETEYSDVTGWSHDKW